MHKLFFVLAPLFSGFMLCHGLDNLNANNSPYGGLDLVASGVLFWLFYSQAKQVNFIDSSSK